ncbi:AI-2E family transporter [Natronococcus jeotgali]|uniref:Permease n=1 Tax=Natronococcus jeotgali DSM 18795 TaxID=1227498 RepID=L9WM50_9EURY|nr:AI-2E family transporter [Natronococcus jeotgali]ELY50545.1 hypothetical protein C492_22257 [Natronococcus jeotgali DSM 18795]
MADGSYLSDWDLEQRGLIAITLLSGVLALLVLVPYLQYVLFGLVLAYVLYPLQGRLENYLRPTIAAFVMVVATLLVVLIPLVYVVTIAVRQALGVVPAIREGQFDVGTVQEVLGTEDLPVDPVSLYESNQDRIATALQQVATGALDFVGSLPGLFIGLTVTLFVLFGLLRDGERVVAWTKWVVPVDDRILDELCAGLDDLMWASVVGNAAVAAVQAVLLGVGLLVAGVPAVIFLTVATFVLTLLPLVGAFGVWIPAAGYLVAVGRPTAGAAVAVYGLLITFSDTYLRPALIGHTDAFDSTIVVVGIFGGLIAFGAVGLFVGPVVLGGAKLTFDCFARAHSGEPAADGHLEGTVGAESEKRAVADANDGGSDE